MKEIRKRVEHTLANSPVAEAVLNVFKAMLATVPFAGAIPSLMTDYIPNSKVVRIEDFSRQVAEDLRAFESRVSENYLLTDNFAFVFEKCFRGVAENYQKEKLDAFRGILVNSAIEISHSEQEKEYFLNMVNVLTALHLRLLKFMSEPLLYLHDIAIDQRKIQGGFSQFFPVALPGVRLEVIKSAFDDLYKYGLINTDKGIFTTMTSGQGLKLLGDRVTPFGRDFMKFCISPAEYEKVREVL